MQKITTLVLRYMVIWLPTPRNNVRLSLMALLKSQSLHRHRQVHNGLWPFRGPRARRQENFTEVTEHFEEYELVPEEARVLRPREE